MNRFARVLIRWLSRPQAHLGVILLGVLLACFSLDTGLGADDHIQQLILRGSREIPGFARDRLDLFSFAGPLYNESLRDDGVFPWWADLDTKLSFFRPLSALTHVVDAELWPESQVMMHAQTVSWFAIGLAGLWSFYRRLLEPRWIAVLALLLYSIDDARAEPIAWIANRNAVVAGALSVWTLVMFHRWRAERWAPGAPLGLLFFALGLASGEGAIATMAYLASYALYLDRGPWLRRALRLAPHAALIVLWRVGVTLLGSSVTGSGVYVDPMREPAEFIAMVFERLPILVLAQLAGPWAAVWNALELVQPGLQHIIMLLAIIVISLTAWLALPLWRRDPVTRFFVVGALLSGVPVCATFPADRLLTWVAIGAMGLVAQLFAALVRDRDRDPMRTSPFSPRIAASGAVGIVLFHLVIAPLTFPMRARGIVAVRDILSLADDSVPRDPSVTTKTIVFANPPADPFASYIPIMRADAGTPRFLRQRWLATGTTEVEIERLDARTLRVRPDDGFLVSSSERMLRSARHPMALGEKVTLTDMTAEITALTWDGRPAEARVTFDVPLEDERFVWMAWEGRGFVPWTPPSVGERVRLPRADFFRIAYGKG